MAVAALLACAVPSPAAAEAVRAPELRSLADRAERDPAARARLRGVDAVDGRPVALGAILDGARPDEIAARVELALDAAARSGEPGEAAGASRGRAREILRDRRFTGTDVLRPFTGVLRWLGDRLGPVARLLDRIAAAVPGGRSAVYLGLALLVLSAALILSRVAIRRGAGSSGTGGREARAARAQDPRALERQAGAAERDGRYEAAVRLRMRAGLLRLDAAKVIAYRPSLTTGEVGRELRSPAFDTLGRDFDAIAYGGREAGEDNAHAAREGWQTVLDETPAPA